MGMSTYIIGYKPPDKKWNEMKEVWDSCEKANIDIPEEVLDFFEGETPTDLGVEVNLEKLDCVQEVKEDMREGFQVDITKIPKDVKYIKFVNSY